MVVPGQDEQVDMGLVGEWSKMIADLDFPFLLFVYDININTLQ